ncbi:hypothetical protein LZ554_001716 [Drepanopeziza brunnea f. sp. 'monogermtubi']|nr:hypothetical protein LZ554_001716 [Drepanopeziza brunnea f. sp. 'monogermtubi']
MPRSKSIFAILTILSFFSNGAQAMFWQKEIVIGYAGVTSEEARDINKMNKLYISQSLPTKQLGEGIYMTNKPEGFSSRATRFCAIKARKYKMNAADKVYIPESYTPETPNGGLRPKQLWGESEEVIVEYIRSLPPLSRFRKALHIPVAPVDEPEKSLRFSWVEGGGGQLQMAIPMKAVYDDDRLKLWAKCFESEAELKKFSAETIEWETWAIRGHIGHPPQPL